MLFRELSLFCSFQDVIFSIFIHISSLCEDDKATLYT